ncbi:Caspase domain [Trypanosoma vivax]|nr:Caspase domain [Trypanosoma vivax]
MECARAAVGRGARPLHWHQLLRDIRAAVGLLQRREAGPRHAAEVRHAHHLCKHPCGRGRFPGRSGQPTRHNILRHLAWLVLGAKPGDVLFLFFAGHGTQTKALHDAAEEFDQCLLPVDYEKNGCILDNDIHKVLLSRLPAGVRLTAVFDCCHSGTMMDLAFKYACSASSAPQCGGHMERIREGNDVKADVLMVSGCEDDQTSADVHDTATLGTGSTGAGGAITQCLTYMIQNRTTASYRDLFHATRDMLHRKGYTQIPQLCASKPLDLQQQFSLMNKFVTDKSVA